jgi:hypothetical protein
MRKLATLGALALMATPAFATDTPTSTAKSSAASQCRSEQKAMGAQAFKDAYGTNADKSNAMGKCVSHRASQNTRTEKASHTNAAKQCQAERSQDPAAFKAKYGTGKNGSNAYGKCVSAKAKARTKATETAQVKAEENAAKACKSERKQDAAAFKAKYGTGRSKANAFGKCVSSKAKTQEKKDDTQS